MIVLVDGKRIAFLSRIGDADRELGIERRERAVIEAAAIAEPVPERVEGKQRHEQDVRPHRGCCGRGLMHPERMDDKRIALAPEPEDERRAFLDGHGQRQGMPLLREPRRQSARIGLITHRPVE